MVYRPDPTCNSENDVKLRTIEVGICHTDHDLLQGLYGRIPEGLNDLVIGHEMIGQIIEAGSGTLQLGIGDYAVCTVRRGCGHCKPCQLNRADMCLTGLYKSRGITGLDGFNSEFIVEDAKYVVKVPKTIAHLGVLIEPCSVAEKAISDAHAVAIARIPGSSPNHDWFSGRRCLVAGLGTVGLLIAMLLLVHGATVYGLDLEDELARRPHWFTTIGGKYLRGDIVSIQQVLKDIGPMDLVFEATGVAFLSFELTEMLARDGIYVLAGLADATDQLNICAGQLLRRLVLNNQTLIGSVNASRCHFQQAVVDLLTAYTRWNKHVELLITKRYLITEISEAFGWSSKDQIKTVVKWS